MRGTAEPRLVVLALAFGVGLAACTNPDDVASGQASSAISSVPRGPSPTTFAAELQTMGLDVRNLPPLHDLDARTRSKVMVTFNRALGVQCEACHDDGDYARPTPQKEAATKAWDNVVRKLTLAGGAGPLYCDSCHYGSFHFLDHSDTTALRAWMRTNFVDKLQRNDGVATACSTCHDTPP